MGKRIFVITSNATLSDLLVGFLKEMGYTVTLCNEPRMAVKRAEREKPDLVLCQHQTEGLTGMELGRLFKSNPVLAEVPFLLMSNTLPPINEMVRTDIQAWADDLVKLPISQSDLYGKVTKWLESDNRLRAIKQPVTNPLLLEKKPNKPRPWNKGSINCAKISRLLTHLHIKKPTGILDLKKNRTKMTVTIIEGAIIDISSNFIRNDSLGNFLIQQGNITPQENKVSLLCAQKEEIPQGKILVRLGMISERDLLEMVARQKVKKLLRLFEGSWDEGAYVFISRIVQPPPMAIEPVSPGRILKAGILKVAKPAMLYDTFAQNKKLNSNISLNPDWKERLAFLCLKQESLDVVEWIHGKNLAKIKKDASVRFDPLVRLAFLLLVSKAATFLDSEATKHQPQTPKMKNQSPTPKMKDQAAAKQIVNIGREKKPAQPMDSSDYETSLVTGRNFVEQKKYTSALPHLKHAFSINSESSEVASLLAWSNFQASGKKSRDIDESKEMLKRALSFDQTNDIAHYYLGMILKHEGNEDLSEAHFKKAHQLNPENESAAREVKLIRMKNRKNNNFTYWT